MTALGTFVFETGTGWTVVGLIVALGSTYAVCRFFDDFRIKKDLDAAGPLAFFLAIALWPLIIGTWAFMAVCLIGEHGRDQAVAKRAALEKEQIEMSALLKANGLE